MKKAQVSMEAIFAVGVIILLFSFIIGYSFNRTNEVRDTKRFILQRDECLKVSDLIMGAFVNGNGTEINTKIGYDTVTLPQSRLIYNTDKEEVTCTVPISNFSKVNLNKGEIKLYNVGDFVVIENE